MFNNFFEKFPDYTINEKPSKEIIDRYSKKLPVQLIQFWTEFGFGAFMDDYLKIINPKEYQDVLNEGYNNPGNVEIVFAITAFGDFLLWTGDAIRAVYFKYGNDTIIESGDDMEWFFDMDLADEGFVKANLNDKNYRAAIEKLGTPAYDECFGYEPVLAAGGVEKADNLKKVKIKEHIRIITQFSGKIQ